jgi:hypothetical protein
MVSSDGTRVGFGGVTLGRASIYGVIANAVCAQGGRHRSPSRWCDCGFYCVHTLDDARALASDPDYRYAVLLEVVASGRFIRYERGLRYARQRVTAVRVGRCACGHHARVFVEAGAATAGWRRLVAVCASCAGTRAVLSFGWLSRMLAGVPVSPDTIAGAATIETEAPDVLAELAGTGGIAEAATSTAATSTVAEGAGVAATESNPQPAPSRVGEPSGTSAAMSDMSEVPVEALVPLLTAEVTLLQARLDEVQRQLARLTPR